MALTHNDICDRLKQVPEVDLLELLDLTSEDIVDRFDDIIRERRDYFESDLR